MFLVIHFSHIGLYFSPQKDRFQDLFWFISNPEYYLTYAQTQKCMVHEKQVFGSFCFPFWTKIKNKQNTQNIWNGPKSVIWYHTNDVLYKSRELNIFLFFIYQYFASKNQLALFVLILWNVKNRKKLSKFLILFKILIIFH